MARSCLSARLLLCRAAQRRHGPSPALPRAGRAADPTGTVEQRPPLLHGDLGRVRFLTMLRRTGMPIEQMRAFVALEREGQASFGARYELLAAHRQDLMARLAELEGHLTYLDEKVRSYWELEQRREPGGATPA
nr:MerR family DNA-binding protein [Deinococcus budaensis]